MEGLKEGILVKAQQNAQLIHVLNQLEKNYKIEKAIKPIFLLRKVNSPIFLPHFEHENHGFWETVMIFAFIEKDEIERCKDRLDKLAHKNSIYLVAIPNQVNVDLALSLMLLFQLALRNAVKDKFQFDLFHLMDEDFSEVRVFDEDKINFVPCSPSLVLKFLQMVYQEEERHALEKRAKCNLAQVDSSYFDWTKNFISSQQALPFGGYLANHSQGIFEFAKEKKLPPNFPASITKQPKFVEQFLATVEEISKQFDCLTYGVGLLDDVGHTKMYNQRRIRAAKGQKMVERFNYQLRNACKKDWMLLNAQAIEEIQLLSEKDLNLINQPNLQISSNSSDLNLTSSSGSNLSNSASNLVMNRSAGMKRKLSDALEEVFAKLESLGWIGFHVFNFDIKK